MKIVTLEKVKLNKPSQNQWKPVWKSQTHKSPTCLWIRDVERNNKLHQNSTSICQPSSMKHPRSEMAKYHWQYCITVTDQPANPYLQQVKLAWRWTWLGCTLRKKNFLTFLLANKRTSSWNKHWNPKAHLVQMCRKLDYLWKMLKTERDGSPSWIIATKLRLTQPPLYCMCINSQLPLTFQEKKWLVVAFFFFFLALTDQNAQGKKFPTVINVQEQGLNRDTTDFIIMVNCSSAHLLCNYGNPVITMMQIPLWCVPICLCHSSVHFNDALVEHSDYSLQVFPHTCLISESDHANSGQLSVSASNSFIASRAMHLNSEPKQIKNLLWRNARLLAESKSLHCWWVFLCNLARFRGSV